jgi:uncharacterized small protein (DUF1192 family)
MLTSLASSLDDLAGWRTALARQLIDFSRFLGEHELLDASADDIVAGVRDRLSSDKLVVAFVAEFSRGKSELINAIFFADTRRRVLPATPGRTTMCTVELGWDPDDPPQLQLLPISTRLDGLTLGELRNRVDLWKTIPVEPSSPDKLAQALTEVMQVEYVPVAEARALGFWNDERPEDNPPLDAEGRVEIPSWRHARINYPHPLLKRGLVVLDTPGLNAIGAEAELTLGLLPSAHATVFVLAADTGVTRSDLAVWREHLSDDSLARYVVLNKIDTLRDPLLTPAEVQSQIERQCVETAATLGVGRERVFPLSAREALAARVDGDMLRLEVSRLPALEAALGLQLLPQRRQMLAQVVLDGVHALEAQALRRLGDRRRQAAEQMLELRGLRGKSAAKLQLMIKRVEQESREFEQCMARLGALKSVHARMLNETLSLLSVEKLRDEVGVMQQEIGGSLLKLGAKKAFLALCQRLSDTLADANRRSEEIQQMLEASFRQLNAEFAFALNVPPAMSLERYVSELELISRNYSRYLGFTHALRLAEPSFMEQFRRMLVSKLGALFDSASSDVELWNKSASQQVDGQLRERRRAFKRRHETLERIRVASGDLEQRIGELQMHEERDQRLLAQIANLRSALEERVREVSVVTAARPEARETPALALVASRHA